MCGLLYHVHGLAQLAVAARMSLASTIHRARAGQTKSDALAAWRANNGLSAQSASSAGGAAADAPLTCLDTRTLFQHPGPWKVTCLDFGDGLVEARAIYIDQPFAKRVKSESDEELIPELVRKQDSVRRSSRRAAANMRRRMWALKPDRLLTLTKRGKFPTLQEAWEAWEKFCSMCSREWGAAWKFVVVPEQHAVFGWHLHVAVRGFVDIRRLLVFWHRALGAKRVKSPVMGSDSPGSVDISRAWENNDPMKLAAYLAKYLEKSLAARELNQRAFASSKGLVPERVIRGSFPACGSGTTPSFLIRRELEDFFGVEFEIYEWRDSFRVGFTLKPKFKQWRKDRGT